MTAFLVRSQKKCDGNEIFRRTSVFLGIGLETVLGANCEIAFFRFMNVTKVCDPMTMVYVTIWTDPAHITVHSESMIMTDVICH